MTLISQRKQTPVSSRIYASAKHPERDIDQVCYSNTLNRDFLNSFSMFQNEIKAKLHFYHVKSKSKVSSSFEPPSPKFPSSKLWSAASFLLFNTAKTPFGTQVKHT